MNEKQIIKKLTLLQNVQPNKTLFTNMKNNVYQQVSPKRKLQSKLLRFFPAQYLSFAFVLIFILGVAYLMQPGSLHTIVLDTKLTFAANQYERANTVFSDTKSISKGDSGKFAYAIARTNTEMSELKLKGEKGKYTEQQCLMLYRQYLSFLDNEATIISTTGQQSSQVKSQINAYREQAEKKLHMYHTL